MKKLFFAMMCMAGLVLTTACGGADKKAPSTGDAQVDEQVEKAEKILDEMSGVDKCEATLQKMYGLTLADVQPDFEFVVVEEGRDKFMGNEVNLATAVYQKKDGSTITEEEWNAYQQKLFNLTARLSQDGKNVHGYDGIKHLTPEEANAVVALEDIQVSHISSWCFKKEDRFKACYMTLADEAEPNYVTVTLTEGLQGNLD